jgi:hypothetical protein
MMATPLGIFRRHELRPWRASEFPGLALKNRGSDAGEIAKTLKSLDTYRLVTAL